MLNIAITILSQKKKTYCTLYYTMKESIKRSPLLIQQKPSERKNIPAFFEAEMRLHELLLKLVESKETVERSGKQLFTCTTPELVNAHKT